MQLGWLLQEERDGAFASTVGWHNITGLSARLVTSYRLVSLLFLPLGESLSHIVCSLLRYREYRALFYLSLLSLLAHEL